VPISRATPLPDLPCRPGDTCAIGKQSAPLPLLWAPPDFFFWGAITMTRKSLRTCAVSEQADWQAGRQAQLCYRRFQAKINGLSTAVAALPMPARG
jgi:hypothetical protein